jgi:hypothetical protein
MDESVGVKHFLEVIEEDVDTAIEILDKVDTSYNRRVFVRNYYSFIEGMLHFFRHEVIAKANKEDGTLTNAELAVLKEETYTVTGNGRIQTQTKHLTFEQSFRLTVQYYFADVIDQVPVNYGDGGWKAMLDGLEIRNRVTHPKYTSELSISNKELDTVKKAKQWGDELFKRLFLEMSNRSRTKIKKLQKLHMESVEATARIQAENRQMDRKLLETQRILRGMKIYKLKYPLVIILGANLPDNGIEVVLQRYMLHDGRKCPFIDPEEAISEVDFPVRQASDIEGIDDSGSTTPGLSP